MQDTTNNKKKSINIDISEDFHKDIKIYIARKGITLKDYIINLIKEDMTKKT